MKTLFKLVETTEVEQYEVLFQRVNQIPHRNVVGIYKIANEPLAR